MLIASKSSALVSNNNSLGKKRSKRYACKPARYVSRQFRAHTAAPRATSFHPDSAPAHVNARALLAIVGYTLSLIRQATGGGDVSAWGKVVVLGVLVLAGVVQRPARRLDRLQSAL